jgi:GT2 family glycosyltransferase
MLSNAGSSDSRLGIVVIGRNEGERLRRCLGSVLTQSNRVVYVDSGSSDGSVPMAQSLGVAVETLDMQKPFTAARARNQGTMRLREIAPEVEFIQFVDGDCEIIDGWLERAMASLVAAPTVAVVCGRLRERYPDKSIYNLLCDMEWDTPIGQAKACGGIAMMRIHAFQHVGGFREELIAGEEPELCVRLRMAGWKIFRLDADMAWHDAAMTHFKQWWRRALRTGFAYGEGTRLHGAPPERHWVREARSAWLWGAGIPGTLALLTLVLGPAVTAAGLFAYALQIVRLAMRLPGDRRERWTRAFFLVLGKFPEALGLFKSWSMNLRRQRAVLIEYK